MQKLKPFIAAVCALLAVYLVLFGEGLGKTSREILGIPDDCFIFRSPDIEDGESADEELPEDVPLPAETPPPAPLPPAETDIVPTTISGGLTIKTSTSYTIDPRELLSAGCPVRLKDGEPQILIIHTHSSEAYSPAGLDQYEDTGGYRTQDNEYNVIRIGDELEALLTEQGLNVIHDRGCYDYPSYTGSYNRSGAAVESYLAEHPSISVVIDLHRDALGSGDVTYKTVATESGVCASQLMFVMGSDEGGLDYPNWRDNLCFALYLQNAVLNKYPSLMRPVTLVEYRYNQHLTTGSLILEVGSNGNTLREALAAIRLFADAAGPALCDLVE